MADQIAEAVLMAAGIGMVAGFVIGLALGLKSREPR